MEEAHSVPQGSSYLNNGLLGYILYYIVYDMWLVTYYLGNWSPRGYDFPSTLQQSV